MPLTRLKQLYTEELELLDSIIELLAIERTAIEKKSPDKIEENTDKKNQLINDLLQIEEQRKQCQAGLEKYNDSSMAQTIHHYENALKDRLFEFQQKNRINGAIIQTHQLFNQQILQILSGKGQDNAGYDSTGKSSENPSEATVIARI